MKIGFIGLGIMGSRMAANLQKNGHSLVVFNRTRAKAEPLLGPCGTFSDSPAKLAEEVDILFTMLARPDVVEEAALGTNGFLNHLRPNALWVDCSSVNPSFSKKMAAAAAARKIRFVDAPVTGSAVPAAEATLVFWVGADPVDLEREMLFGSLLGTPPVAPFLASKRAKIESGNYETEFPLRWMQKDMHLASVSGYESGVAIPVANAVKELYRLAMREGHATQDFSAVYDYLTTTHKSPAPAKA